MRVVHYVGNALNIKKAFGCYDPSPPVWATRRPITRPASLPYPRLRARIKPRKLKARELFGQIRGGGPGLCGDGIGGVGLTGIYRRHRL